MKLKMMKTEMDIHKMTDIQRVVAMDDYEKGDLMQVIHRMSDELSHLWDALDGYMEYERTSKETSK